MKYITKTILFSILLTAHIGCNGQSTKYELNLINEKNRSLVCVFENGQSVDTITRFNKPVKLLDFYVENLENIVFLYEDLFGIHYHSQSKDSLDNWLVNESTTTLKKHTGICRISKLNDTSPQYRLTGIDEVIIMQNDSLKRVNFDPIRLANRKWKATIQKKLKDRNE